jgi:hypothetical protein
MTVSWLVLEQYAMGDLGPEQTAQVEAALAADPDLQARLDAIRADARPVPTLPLILVNSPPPTAQAAQPAPASPPPVTRSRRPRSPWWGRGAAGLVTFAIAAVALLMLVPSPPPDRPTARTNWKGGELSLSLDRSRDGTITPHADSYRDGDRFQVRLTCAPGDRTVSIDVRQRGVLSLHTDTPALACGNAVVVPGGFELTRPGEVEVCALVDDDGEVCTVLVEG